MPARSASWAGSGAGVELEAGFSVAGREVIPLEGRIGAGGAALRVEPKAMAVLLELARHAPQLRTRRQIEQAVWPRGYVSEDVLTRCIGQLRRALGDDARAPRLLETLPRRGYRLCAAVEPIGAAALQAAPVRSGGQPETLLVLPFRHLAAQPEGYVAEGLTELLTLRLCSLRGVRILSRTSAAQFADARISVADIAARTGADWIVEGSVLQAGDRVQVIVQLIDARTDAHIWAADHTRGLGDLLAVQNDIAQSVATAIRAQLGVAQAAAPAALALGPAAVRDYLRGRHLLSRRSVPALREAIGAFATVSQAQPDYAPAWASRAECEMLLMHYGAEAPAALLADCQAHLERALALDPDLAIGLSTRGAMRFFFALDFDGAARDLEQALGLLPSYGLAMVQLASVAAVRGRFDEARAWIEQALLVDPLDVGVNMNLGDHLILQRCHADAVQALQACAGAGAGAPPVSAALGLGAGAGRAGRGGAGGSERLRPERRRRRRVARERRAGGGRQRRPRAGPAPRCGPGPPGAAAARGALVAGAQRGPPPGGSMPRWPRWPRRSASAPAPGLSCASARPSKRCTAMPASRPWPPRCRLCPRAADPMQRIEADRIAPHALAQWRRAHARALHLAGGRRLAAAHQPGRHRAGRALQRLPRRAAPLRRAAGRRRAPAVARRRAPAARRRRAAGLRRRGRSTGLPAPRRRDARPQPDAAARGRGRCDWSMANPGPTRAAGARSSWPAPRAFRASCWHRAPCWSTCPRAPCD
jgi:TolB-like protein